MTRSYQLHELGPIGAKIDDGSQGIIYALEWEPSLVFKRYKNNTYVDEATLTALIDWPARLVPAEQALLHELTAWPRGLVRDGSGVVGVVMPRAPARFVYQFPDGTSTLTTLTLAYNANLSDIFQNLPVPNQVERLWLAYSLCRLLALFERNNLLYLDLSSKNILWSLNPTPVIFLLDCDSAFLLGQPTPRARIMRTENFYDPWFQNPPTHAEARCIFSLLFARLVFAKEYDNDKSHIILPADHPYALTFQPLVDSGYARNHASRPSMATWQAQIEKALGIAHDPPKKLLRYVPGATRLLQQTKQTYEELKNTVVVLNIKRILFGIPTFIVAHHVDIVPIVVVCLLIIALFVIHKKQNQIDKKINRGTLFESVWKNNISVKCTHNLAGLSIYASGEQKGRILRIIVPFNNPPLRERHYIIKSDVIYWWDVQYGAKTQGNKSYIDEVAIKKLLRPYQKDYVSGSLRCEFWFDPEGRVFALPHLRFLFRKQVF